jgi:hypothetical protein
MSAGAPEVAASRDGAATWLRTFEPPQHRQLAVDETEQLRLRSAEAPVDRESNAGCEFRGAAGGDAEVVAAVLAAAPPALGCIQDEALDGR